MQNELRIPDEPVRLDPDRLTNMLEAAGGPRNADAAEALARALERVTAELALIRRAVLAREIADVGPRAAALALLCAGLGLSQLAAVCHAVSVSAARQDLPALGATAARLQRLGESSLTLLWDGPSGLS